MDAKNKPILYLTLKREWFDKIARGEKTEEYRSEGKYWDKRLVTKNGFYRTFKEVHFRNGYNKKNAFMRVKCKGVYLGYRVFNNVEQMVYVIALGKILEIKNWEESDGKG